jgi:hypothetical protein
MVTPKSKKEVTKAKTAGKRMVSGKAQRADSGDMGNTLVIGCH